MRTRYKINNRGREWYMDDPDTHELEYWKQQGATITTETMTHDTDGIPLTRLTSSELERLHELAEDMDWQEVTHMVRDEAQQRVEQ